MTEPQYSFAVKNEYCSFMAYINDVPAMFNPDGYAFNLNVPINHLIQPGKNNFRVHITIQDQSEETKNYCECISEILVKGTNDPMSSLKTLAQINIRSLVKNSILSLPPGSPVTGIFQVKDSFSELPWSEGVDMGSDKNRYVKLAMDELKSLHLFLKKKDTEPIFKIIRDREQHYSASYYEEFNQSFEKTKADFTGTLEDQDFILQDLDFTEYLPVFYAGGKLIAFENKYGEQPVFFLNNKKNLRRQYAFYFSCFDEQRLKVVL